jgi:hypothetical protein
MQAPHTGTVVPIVRVHTVRIQQAKAEQLEHDALLR